ncbi:MAG: shikimate kinase AroK [Candidatus Sedimenticola endophacoides]
MARNKNIFLIGPMGAGKTTIGRQLAAVLGLGFHDSDREIQRRTGVDIPTIFDFEGEVGFRRREREVIDQLTQADGLVLATGGGAVADAANRGCLAARGTVVYLHCAPEQQYQRTACDRSRPLLRTEDPLARLRELMAEREPLYRELADVVVSTERRSLKSVVGEIVRRLEGA